MMFISVCMYIMYIHLKKYSMSKYNQQILNKHNKPCCILSNLPNKHHHLPASWCP